MALSLTLFSLLKNISLRQTASATLNVGSPIVGGIVMEAVPLDDEKMIKSTGVFAIYYGLYGGFSGGSPVDADIAVSNYTRLHREQYTLVADVDSKRNDIASRRTVASLMTTELLYWMTAGPIPRALVPQALIELWDFANDTSN